MRIFLAAMIASFRDAFRSNILKVQLRGDLHAALQRAGHRAELGVHVVHTLGGFPLPAIELQMVLRMDALDHQDLALQFHLAPGFRHQTSVAGRDFARFQRAAEGSGQSACSGRHDVVKGGRMGLVNAGIDAVVPGNLGVHPEKNGCRYVGQINPAQRPLDALDPHV
jgi:hypothetical protein